MVRAHQGAIRNDKGLRSAGNRLECPCQRSVSEKLKSLAGCHRRGPGKPLGLARVAWRFFNGALSKTVLPTGPRPLVRPDRRETGQSWQR